MKQQNRIIFTINDKTYSVGNEILPDTTLNQYIRNYVNCKGTKFMCLEGGCGACIVCVKKTHPVTNNEVIFAVNSCLVPIFSCYGWGIIVIEGIGNKNTGYHQIQRALAGFNGTQCGYCSPGMVMNMFGLTALKGKVTMEEVENAFGGNICRCTGYRPILDAFKSLAVDASPDLKKKIVDIEDLTNDLICRSTGKVCINSCSSGPDEMCESKRYIPKLEELENIMQFELSDGSKWYRAQTINQIFDIFNLIEDNKSYMLVAGHTSHGVYRVGYNDYYICINNIAELQIREVKEDVVVLGANISLSEAIEFLKTVASQYPTKFAYLKDIAEHMELIANVPVRNVGTLAGNLSMKHEHNDFPSDLFLILECASAQLTIGDVSGIVNDFSLQDYLNFNMRKKVIYRISLPSFDTKNYVYRSFKIMQRAQNTHAYVNAAFLCELDQSKQFQVVKKPSLVFGGISSSFIHAKNTETFLTGKSILCSDVFKRAIETLSTEINPEEHPPEASAQYRKLLAISLFYKFVLGLAPDSVSNRYKSGAQLLHRPLSSGKQDFDTDKSKWPLTKPIPKLEALIQCAGEAEYVGDIPRQVNEVYASFVISPSGPGKVLSIDPTEALKMPGVIRFLSAKDIPGKNTFVEVEKVEDEELFAEKEVKCAGQTIGVIVAESQLIANAAAEKVKVDIQLADKLYLSAKEIIDNNIQSRIKLDNEVQAKKKKIDRKSEDDYNITGSFFVGGQYHFTMETQSCFCVPTEDGMDVYPATQWITGVHVNICAALSMPQNSINVNVRRIGGGYGSKLGRSALVATACAVAAYNQKVPVRMTMPLETNMRAVGKRFPFYVTYEIVAGESGLIKQLNLNVYSDVGYSLNDKLSGTIITVMQQSLYDAAHWNLKEYAVITDCASNTYCRSPAFTEAIAIMEYIMEHIAAVTGQDPVSVRLANIKSKETVIPNLIDDLKKISEFENRKLAVDTYNKQNRWKKKGISLIPMNYPFWFSGTYHITLSVFAVDGTVALSHGGIEMGQGINTKVAQVCAYFLAIDVSKIKVKSSNTLTAPNDAASGGSMASDGVCYAAVECCKILLERLKPIRGRSKNMTWEELIAKAYSQNVDLFCEYMFANNKSPDLDDYAVYGVTVAEVEVDILTGQLQILRVDILEDVGQSISPDVDVGQVEGAFVMGLGYWLTEKLVFDRNTGKLLTDRTWNYTPPGAKDIPIDFRVHFRRNAPNLFGVLRSKATGEPPLCMSIGVVFAIRNALQSARKDAGNTENWFDISFPCIPENIMLNSMTNINQFIIKD